MGNDFFTWGNFITWVVCSILIYFSLSFRLYMTFHHPGRKLKEKSRMRGTSRVGAKGESSHVPGLQGSKWDRECPDAASCFRSTGSILRHMEGRR